MFFSTQLLSKKGPLATVWLAGHMDKRLKKAQIIDTSISNSVDNIINSEAPLALRLSGQLLLGVVRIHARKVVFLYNDCNEAVVRLKQAFKAHDVDLPEGNTQAPEQMITLPEILEFEELELLGTERFSLDSFDPGAPAPAFRLEGRDSFLLADDWAALHSQEFEEEQFEIGGEDFERHLSLGTPEKLRAAPSGDAAAAAGRNSLGLGLDYDSLYAGSGGGDVAYDGEEDERMAPMPAELLEGPGSVPRRPPSDVFAPRESLGLPISSGGLDLGSLPTPGDSLGAPTPQLNIEGLQEQDPTPAQQRPRLPPRKRCKLDVVKGKEGLVANITLPGAEIRALLKDRSELMTLRGANPHLVAGLQQRADPFAVAGYSVQAHDSVLHRPGVSAVMAPELYALYEEAMALPASLSAPADDEREQGALEQDNLGGYDAYPVDEEIHGDGAAADGGVAHAAEEAGGAKGQAPAAGSARKSVRSPGIAQPLTAEGNEGPMLKGAGNTQTEADLGAELQGGADMDMDVDTYTPGVPATSAGTAAGSQQPSRPAGSGGSGQSSQDVIRAQGLGLGPASSPDSQAQEDTAKTSFTSRTKKVLAHLHSSFEGGAGPSSSSRKRRHPSSAAEHLHHAQASLDGIVAGKSRLDASRWFFEMLVLKTRDYIDLEQQQPFGDITIRPRPAFRAPT